MFLTPAAFDPMKTPGDISIAMVACDLKMPSRPSLALSQTRIDTKALTVKFDRIAGRQDRARHRPHAAQHREPADDGLPHLPRVASRSSETTEAQSVAGMGCGGTR